MRAICTRSRGCGGDAIPRGRGEHPAHARGIRTWVQSKVDLFERDGGMSLWALVERESGRVIGDAGLQWETIAGERELDLGCRDRPALARPRRTRTEASTRRPARRARTAAQADDGADRDGQCRGPRSAPAHRVPRRGRDGMGRPARWRRRLRAQGKRSRQARRPSRQCGSSGAPGARCAAPSTPGAAPAGRAPRS